MASAQRHIVGVDIGGTFTDAVAIDTAGRVVIGKASSTPPDFEQGFVDSLQSAADRLGIALGDLVQSADGIYHGCTVGTNALVENRAAKVGLLTTRGHRDSLFLMQAGGRFVGIEAKVGKDRVRPNQRRFADALTKAGGLYIEARSVDDVTDALRLEALL